MRSSGWSSLVISIFSAAAAALLVAAPAAAHLSLTPKTADVGEDVDLVFAVPNEDDARGIVRVTVGAPSAFALDDGEAKPGWTQSRSGQAVTWSGGRIPKGQFATFTLRGTAPNRPETVLFNVLAGSQSGETTTYRVALDVKESGESDTGARTLGRAALFIALGAAALAIGAGFLALYVWLRPPPP
jgi:uncharacterized protein YcnI